MDYNEALEYICQFGRFGIKPGLERIGALTDALDNPQKNLKFIHIAGTNGKGSTARMLAGVLTAQGYKTGLYISPYIIDFRERIQINNEFIPKQELIGLVDKIKPVTDELRLKDMEPTEFEIITAMAFLYFARSKCDFVILETGLGGRYDATNIIEKPLVSVITSVSYDHMNILGDSLKEIAEEKCGIIKENSITVSYCCQDIETASVIMEHCSKKNNRLIMANPNSVDIISSDLSGTCFNYGGLYLKLPLVGEHQVFNALTAVETLYQFRGLGFNLSDDAIKNGIKSTVFPARFEKINSKPLVFLDGAHNPSGMKTLCNIIKKHLSTKKILGITGMLRDKQWKQCMDEILPLCSSCYTVTPNIDRALQADELREYAARLVEDCRAYPTVAKAIEDALSEADDNTAVIIFGSLYLASEARGYILDNNTKYN